MSKKHKWNAHGTDDILGRHNSHGTCATYESASIVPTAPGRQRKAPTPPRTQGRRRQTGDTQLRPPDSAADFPHTWSCHILEWEKRSKAQQCAAMHSKALQCASAKSVRKWWAIAKNALQRQTKQGLSMGSFGCWAMSVLNNVKGAKGPNWNAQ